MSEEILSTRTPKVRWLAIFGCRLTICFLAWCAFMDAILGGTALSVRLAGTASFFLTTLLYLFGFGARADGRRSGVLASRPPLVALAHAGTIFFGLLVGAAASLVIVIRTTPRISFGYDNAAWIGILSAQAEGGLGTREYGFAVNMLLSTALALTRLYSWALGLDPTKADLIYSTLKLAYALPAVVLIAGIYATLKQFKSSSSRVLLFAFLAIRTSPAILALFLDGFLTAWTSISLIIFSITLTSRRSLEREGWVIGLLACTLWFPLKPLALFVGLTLAAANRKTGLTKSKHLLFLGVVPVAASAMPNVLTVTTLSAGDPTRGGTSGGVLAGANALVQLVGGIKPIDPGYILFWIIGILVLLANVIQKDDWHQLTATFAWSIGFSCFGILLWFWFSRSLDLPYALSKLGWMLCILAPFTIATGLKHSDLGAERQMRTLLLMLSLSVIGFPNITEVTFGDPPLPTTDEIVSTNEFLDEIQANVANEQILGCVVVESRSLKPTPAAASAENLRLCTKFSSSLARQSVPGLEQFNTGELTLTEMIGRIALGGGSVRGHLALFDRDGNLIVAKPLGDYLTELAK